MSTYRGDVVFDHVASGCVWSGDAYASTRNGSQTSGVVYISGVRLTVAAVSAHLFTASKDTYIDINGSGVQVYTEATNNAASPALTAGSVRIGIIITGATTIAAATSVNQGQETMVLPIASSIPYAVTDSLGNLICPRDPNRKVLGYRQLVAGLTTTSGTFTQITGLSIPVIVPTGRKIKISVGGPNMSASAIAYSYLAIYDGAVPAGTELQQGQWVSATAGYATAPFIYVTTTPSASSKTYNIGFKVDSGTLTLSSATTNPTWALVELL